MYQSVHIFSLRGTVRAEQRPSRGCKVTPTLTSAYALSQGSIPAMTVNKPATEVPVSNN